MVSNIRIKNHILHLFYRYDFDYKLNKLKDYFWFWFVSKLPKKLIYYCAIRLMVAATVGVHNNTIVPELTCIEALKRWKM